ncbi:uncharacterized protein PFL1_00795 [Pseudozyma flocculosa PF-1]|uniref:Uncharacterized protein n=1 Tax=Pseudozyma flocculosa TaxID=84751 RepID=A0A5C3F505_9BASI|nr:uncharacterized protein PFL1_00795 [Pseudozyma flocculosa PF-1]EPQ31460.1 hypothetical protein PFL1_00795 [Pseudozyma flocculosa PF-1]SPO38757.1 uncharacterized protein PSFLO_04236 [Pseudozyma flocculosa]
MASAAQSPEPSTTSNNQSIAPRTPGGPSDQRQDHVVVVALLVEPASGRDRARFDRLQEVRRVHDQAFDRWLPHITLIPPFFISGNEQFLTSVDEAGKAQEPDDASANDDDGISKTLTELSSRLETACRQHEQHHLLVDQVSSFKLRAYTNIHLRPGRTRLQPSAATPGEDEVVGELERDFQAMGLARGSSVTMVEGHETILRLQQDLHACLLPVTQADRGERRARGQAKGKRGQHQGRSRGGQAGGSRGRSRSSFKPHISVGQAKDDAERTRLFELSHEVLRHGSDEGQDADVAGSTTKGIVCRVDRVTLLHKPLDRPGAYDVWRHFELSDPRGGL